MIRPELDRQLGCVDRAAAGQGRGRAHAERAQAWHELEDIAIGPARPALAPRRAAARGDRAGRGLLHRGAVRPAADERDLGPAARDRRRGGHRPGDRPGPYTPPPGPTAQPLDTPPVGPPTPAPIAQTPPPEIPQPAPPSRPRPRLRGTTRRSLSPPLRDADRALLLWFVVLVVLAGGAAAAALVLRPNDEPTQPPSATATPSVVAGDGGPQRFVTAAYDVELPAGWEQQCSEQVVCNKAKLNAGGRRSAFSKGSGTAGAGTTIDHYELAGALTLDRLAESQEQTLNQLPGYVRTGDEGSAR